MHAKIILISIFLAAIFCGGTFVYVVHQFGLDPIVASLPTLEANEPNTVSSQNGDETLSIIFAGDVMLARDVEKRLLNEERGFALSAIKDLLIADAVVMNFEASIPETHIQTQFMEMRFSVLPDLINELKTGSPTHLSLANNHSLDYGALGFSNTKKVLNDYGFKSFGHATLISSSSLSVIETKGQRVLIVYLNATYGDVDVSLVKGLVDSVGGVDLKVVYVHWGTEYEPINDKNQEKLAHSLVDSGFNLVVGHHPHVVQNIEKYKDGIIFYSLGNFIFDQYWMPSVREGLLLKVMGSGNEWEVDLLPVESTSVRIQPREMTSIKQQTFLEELSSRSSLELRADIVKGKILLQF